MDYLNTDYLKTDPVDHHRTTRKHAGETLKNGSNAPGLVAVAIGVITLIVGLYLLATGDAIAGTVAVVVALVAGTGGLGWLAFTHRRVRQAEQRLYAEAFDQPAPPPTS
ncbi:hypothetical protein [Mycobacterium bourgelatii]|uniref:UsfY protein n=1 Tax=Mycobacterium bourgelatii TaxID=1273442 RepID=A0A7I9YS92_MYCBU|nr:hypothetical protein [Mycobacterium bourgelatii]MCV6974577.1 hypothetical protein [Mycobacterium bourgelatii]GFG91536.1 usfY protein [Mycobacterium bourgelatii]